MQFIAELNESRMYKRLTQLRGKNMNDIAERLFEHLLALQILAYEKPEVARSYSEQIMKHQDFKGFRTSQPDLFNLIVLALKPEQYGPTIQDPEKLSVPELRLRRNLRAIANGNFDPRDFSQMMLILQRHFDSIPMQLYSLRRQVGDWPRLPSSSKADVIKRLLINMRERGMQSDFYEQLYRLLKTV
jgi:hypothetical protein